MLMSILTSLSSCSYYISSTTLPTAFVEKNEKSISGSVSTQGSFANLAYSPVEHFYVVAEGALSRQSYNYSGGIGGYFQLDDKVSVEANTQYGWGSFDWGDPINGSSEPSQINLAVGELNQIKSLGAINFHFEKGSKLSATLVHRYLDVSFSRTSSDDPSINKKLNSTYVNLIGAHLTYRQRISDYFNLIGGIGIHGTSETVHYTYNPFYLRVGFEFR